MHKFGLNDTKAIKNIFTLQGKIKYSYSNIQHSKHVICSVRELAGGETNIEISVISFKTYVSNVKIVFILERIFERVNCKPLSLLPKLRFYWL